MTRKAAVCDEIKREIDFNAAHDGAGLSGRVAPLAPALKRASIDATAKSRN